MRPFASTSTSSPKVIPDSPDFVFAAPPPAASPLANTCLPFLSKASKPGEGDASTRIRPSAPRLTARSPGPTPGKRRVFAVSSPSVWPSALSPASNASRHNSAAILDIQPLFCCMNPQITWDVAGLLRVAASLSATARLAGQLVTTQSQPLDRLRAQASRRIARSAVIGFDQHAVHLQVTPRDVEPRRQAIQEAFDDGLAVPADHA